MPQQYQGKNISVVRSSRQGDPSYDASKTDQVVVRFEDGTEKTVLRSELTNKP